jgi:hypothetical protein
MGSQKRTVLCHWGWIVTDINNHQWPIQTAPLHENDQTAISLKGATIPQNQVHALCHERMQIRHLGEHRSGEDECRSTMDGHGFSMDEQNFGEREGDPSTQSKSCVCKDEEHCSHWQR